MRPDDPNQLALLEPCPICKELTPGRYSGELHGIFTAGHEFCYYAARRWYPHLADRFETRNPRASSVVAARAERAVQRRVERTEWRAWKVARTERPARAEQAERADLRVVS